jgi:predicted RNA-binding protein YlxR (DUF448 family)
MKGWSALVSPLKISRPPHHLGTWSSGHPVVIPRPTGYPGEQMESRAPLRTCIGCRRKGDQTTFFRVSRLTSGVLAATQGKDRTGRGAYICPRPECIEAALKGDRLGRALRSHATLNDKEALQELLTNMQAFER